MKIAIDVSPLQSAHQYRGIGSYTRNLVESLKIIDKKNEYFLVSKDRELSQLNPDVVHYPCFDFFQLTLPFKKIKPTIVTVYDVIPLIFPEHFPTGLRGRVKFEIQKYYLKGVKAVITISENSKKDIVKYLAVPEEKIFVTYLAPGKEFKKLEIKPKYNLPNTFVLYVGDVNWNKNILGLIKAFHKLETKNLKLILVGKAFENKDLKETREIIRLIKQLDLDDKIIRLGWVPDEELVAIYNSASVYCQPSFYEGFGLPVLEAMACGCPVVAAKAGSLPEICGDAALMVAPGNVSDIARGISQVVENKNVGNELINKGFKQANKFSWDKTARLTLSVYNKVYEQRT